MSKTKEEKIVDEKFPEDGKQIEDVVEQVNEVLNPSEIPQSSPYEIRDTYYSQILSNYNAEYISRRKQIKSMRDWMFWIMLSILGLIVVSSFAILIIIVCKRKFSVESVISLITVSVPLVSAILTIPAIIAKSLFPEKEDNQIVEVLTKLIENDNNIRNCSKSEEREK